MGQDFLDLVFRHADNPSMMKTYWQRRLAVNTCNGLHNCLFRPTRGSRTRKSPPPPPDTVSHPEHSEASEQTACANDEDLLETRPSPSPGSPAPHRNTEHTSPMDLDDFDFLEHTDNHIQLRPTSDHSQPDPVGSGVIPPVRAASASGTTASQHRQTRDHRHEHLPISLGVIPSPRNDLAPSSTASPTHPQGNHSHEPLPVSSGVTSPHMSLVSAVSAATASQLRPMSDHSHEPLPANPGVISPPRTVPTASASGTTASQLRQTCDHRHEHLPISLGVIHSPRTDLAPSPTASPTRPPRNHSHEPLPVSSGVISPHTSLVSATAASRLRSMAPTSRPRSALSSTTSAPLPPLGSAPSSVMLASPSPSTSAPGVAKASASRSALRRPPSFSALASSLSPGPRS